MQLGAFSVSLSVKDLETSKSFYEKLGFRQTGGDETGYLIMANDTTIIGLFHGMFEGNILTFNPGLAQDMSRAGDLHGREGDPRVPGRGWRGDLNRYRPGRHRTRAHRGDGSGRESGVDRSVLPEAGERGGTDSRRSHLSRTEVHRTIAAPADQGLRGGSRC